MLRQVVSLCATTGLLLVGCSSHPAVPIGSAASGAAPHSTESTRAGEMLAPTAREIVEELGSLGFAVLNPLDTTAQECPRAGCDQSIVTDTLRVKSFPTTGKAQIYAADRRLDQVETIVVSFAPPVSQVERDRYWAQIEKLVR